MRALPFRLPRTGEESLQVQLDELDHFYDRLHHHPEFQITLFERGSGTCVVGDYIGPFAPGDLMVLGAHLPHRFHDDDDDAALDGPHRGVKSISLYFDREVLGPELFSLPELSGVSELLKRAGQGLHVCGATRDQASALISSMVQQTRFKRFVSLLELLHLLSGSDEVRTLASQACAQRSDDDHDGNKMAVIVEHVMQNYTQSITLDEISRVAKMSTSAFCRYFKVRTQKTFTDFVNEVRIGSACRMLVGSERTIKEVCYYVGYNNVSHFNRQFKAKTGHTPTAYLEKFGAR